MFETEEIWGLDDGCEWITIPAGSSDGPCETLPLWPYEVLATEWVKATEECKPTAESLEDFDLEVRAMLERNEKLVPNA